MRVLAFLCLPAMLLAAEPSEVAGSAGVEESSVIAEHTGNNDPLTGDPTPWERTASGNASYEEPVDSPLPAWRIADEGNAVVHYSYVPTAELMDQAEEYGWKLSLKCRLDVPSAGEPNFSVMAGYVDIERSRRFLFGLNANASGEPLILFDKHKGVDGQIEIPGLKADEFHLYEWVYDPVTQTVTLSVDGEQRAFDIPSSVVSKSDTARIVWGAGDTRGTGVGAYNLVRFEILSDQITKPEFPIPPVSTGLPPVTTTAQTDPSLVLHYRFDQPGDEVKDLSGHHNDGKIVNGEHLDEFQGREGVLRLNGTSAYVDCGKGKSLQLDGDTTFEMWIRQNGELLNKWSVIFADDPSKGLHFSIAHQYGLDFVYRGPDFNGAEMMAIPVRRDIISKEWSHIAIVVEYPRLRFYCDGKLVRDQFMPIRGLSTTAQGANKRIGGRENAFAPIDLTEFRIYRRALAADEIAQNAAGKGPEPIETSELFVEPNWYQDELTIRLVTKNIAPPEKEAEFTLSENGTEVAQTTGTFEKVSENDSSRFAATAVFPLRKLEGKTMKIMARSGSDDGLSREVILNEPDWIREKAGLTTRVLPPWTPIQVEREGENLSLKVWGRSYDFGSLLLPRQIESAGEPLFTKPVTLESRVNGKTFKWAAGPIEVKEQSDASVRLEQTLTSGLLTLKIRAQLEFDGFLIYDLDVSASTDTQLDELGLVVSFIPDRARLGYAERALPRESPKNIISEWFSGEITKPLNFHFSPNVWLGDDERGLDWQAESNEFWSNADPQKAIVITPGKESTTLRANFVDTGRILESGESLSYRFALLAMPVKPLRRDAWDFRIARYEPWGKEIEMAQRTTPDGTPEAKAIVDLGVRHLFTNVNDIWPWPMPTSEVFAKATHSMIGAAHKYGLKLHNYAIHQRVPVNVPEFDLYGLDMSNRPLKQYIQPLGHNPKRPGPILLDYGGDSHAAVMMCAKGAALQDAYLHALEQRLKTFGDDGVYLDGTIGIVPCMNAEHGCGYLGADGLRKVTYPVFAVREMMRRINAIVKSHDPDGIIDVHCSFSYNLAGLAYADVMWTGEQWYHLRNTGTDYVSGQLTLDKFRTEFTGRQIGIGAETLHYRLRNTMKVSATSLLHDISVRYSMPATDNIKGRPDPYFSLVPKIWRMRDKFGANEAEKLFYYNNQDYVTVAGERGYATLLKHPHNGTLALVSNLSREKQDLTVSFNLQKLGLSAGEVSVTDPLTGKDVPISAEGKVALPLGSEEWEYLWLKPVEIKKS